MMMRSLSRSLLAAAFLPVAALPRQVAAQDTPFIGVRVDQDRNKVLLEIPADRFGKDFLHQSVLATGAGVSALGLDRGQVGGSDVVRLERRGKRVALVQDHWSVRALGADSAGRRTASEGFATSVTASFPIESESGGTVVSVLLQHCTRLNGQAPACRTERRDHADCEHEQRDRRQYQGRIEPSHLPAAESHDDRRDGDA